MGKKTLTAKEMKKKKEQSFEITITIIVLVLVAVLSIVWVLKDDNSENSGTTGLTNWFSDNVSNEKESGEKEEMQKDNNKYANVEKNPVVTMEMTSGDIVKIELYPQIAPTTVENFISLINKGFYNGLTFHRVMPEFMAQGGDPSGDGTGGPDYSIYGEFTANGFTNDLKHDIGVISMARATEYNSAGSQFFIVTNEQSYLSLDGQYAGFGKVIEGMDAVYTIVNAETKRQDYSEEFYAAVQASGGEITTEELYIQYLNETTEMTTPKNPPTIKTMTVDTFGYEYDEPEKL